MPTLVMFNKIQENVDFALKNTNKIRHIHIHDYDVKKDHLTLGSGRIAFKKYNELINKNL